jgi:hypothetical protein
MFKKSNLQKYNQYTSQRRRVRQAIKSECSTSLKGVLEIYFKSHKMCIHLDSAIPLLGFFSKDKAKGIDKDLARLYSLQHYTAKKPDILKYLILGICIIKYSLSTK